jgi:hypothetical protein
MSTNFDPEPSFHAPPPKEMMTNPDPSVGSIHLKVIEVNHKCHIEDIEVSSQNKTLKNVTVEAPSVDLTSKSRLYFVEVPKVDELNGARETKCNKIHLLPLKPHVNEEFNMINDTFLKLEENTLDPSDEGDGNLVLLFTLTYQGSLHKT